MTRCYNAGGRKNMHCWEVQEFCRSGKSCGGLQPLSWSINTKDKCFCDLGFLALATQRSLDKASSDTGSLHAILYVLQYCCIFKALCSRNGRFFKVNWLGFAVCCRRVNYGRWNGVLIRISQEAAVAWLRFSVDVSGFLL